ncbi:type III restriction endonuclease subunit R, partial [Actinobacillus pleuropneumoniae]|nr:type III restriction endonuclease subunit R [Actinobacillus pleuropneumoniae]
MLKGQKMKRTFHDNLILNRYLLSLFNQDNLEKFKQRLGDDRFEGIDNDGQAKFFHELTGGQLFQTDLISANDLRRYDLNIVKHWQQITENRNKAEGHILNLKYFQYLSLLFT